MIVLDRLYIVYQTLVHNVCCVFNYSVYLDAVRDGFDSVNDFPNIDFHLTAVSV